MLLILNYYFYMKIINNVQIKIIDLKFHIINT